MSRPAPLDRVIPPAACVDDGSCITCSDHATPVRVVAVSSAGLAVCLDDAGSRSEIMTELVGEVAVGDRLLVHAGTALLRLAFDAGGPDGITP